MKRTLPLLLAALLLTGTAYAQVEIGEGVEIGQNESTINTTGEFNVSNLVSREFRTTIDRVDWTIEGNSSVRLSYFNRDADTSEYLTNFSASAPNGVNFTYSNLETVFYRTFNDSDVFKTAESDGDYFFYYDQFGQGYTNFSIINFLDSIPPSFQNVEQNRDSYLINDPENLTLSATVFDDDTGIDKVYLSTNETREFENHTTDYGGTREFDGEETVDVSFTWDNEFNIRQHRTVAWKIWAKDKQGNWNSTKLKTFDINENPVVLDLSVEDVRQGQTSNLRARVVDPVGYGDIVNVTFKIQKPSGDTHHIRARRGKKIEDPDTGYTGNIYHFNFTDTTEAGVHIVEAISYDETSQDSKQEILNVGGIFDVLREFFLNPFYIGTSTLPQALLIIIKKHLTLIGVLGFLTVFTVYAVYSTEKRLSREVYKRFKARVSQ